MHIRKEKLQTVADWLVPQLIAARQPAGGATSPTAPTG